MDKDTLDPTVNVHTTLYHQLSTLLKSIMAVSRVTPTYRHYVKNQSPDTYVIFYRVRLITENNLPSKFLH